MLYCDSMLTYHVQVPEFRQHQKLKKQTKKKVCAVCDRDGKQMIWTMLGPGPSFAVDTFETNYTFETLSQAP